jgi:hypothetical protein
MPSDIKDRLEKAIQEQDEQIRTRLRMSRERARSAEQEFAPVRRAAEEIREQLQSVPDIEFTVNPDSVWITLADRDLTFAYDVASRNFVGEESAHSWYDGERYADSYKWDTSEACVDAMIRLCARYARYARMARAIRASALEE